MPKRGARQATLDELACEVVAGVMRLERLETEHHERVVRDLERLRLEARRTAQTATAYRLQGLLSA